MAAVRVVCALVLIVGCSKPHPPAIEDSGPARASWSIPHRVAGTWKGEGGVEWEAIVVHPAMSHADLVRLAHVLHAEKPTTFFDVYDDDTELPSLIEAHGNDDALPKAWREAHAVGSIAGAVTTSDGGAVVRDLQLIEWKSLRTTKL